MPEFHLSIAWALLVVIAIIALLIGILFPALGKARPLARQPMSSTNHPHITVANYADEYKDKNSRPFPSGAIRGLRANEKGHRRIRLNGGPIGDSHQVDARTLCACVGFVGIVQQVPPQGRGGLDETVGHLSTVYGEHFSGVVRFRHS